MKCGTPIISGNLTSLPEVAGNAALYCDPFDVQDIAAKMAEFYSDKLLQQQLAIAGLERSKQFSWDVSSEIVWQQIINLSKPYFKK
jgi:glycosyltransferase involved in cell wall biosynthesis